MLKQINELTEDQINYRAKRIEKIAGSSHDPSKDVRHVSPCGKYMLLIEHWERYTVGVIYRGDEVIGRVHRNYSAFPFSWACDHPSDGHDYLVCSENYMGTTFVRLDTGERADFKGSGWIWADIQVSPGKTEIACAGCVWGSTYSIRVFDFSEPMTPPGSPLHISPGMADECRWNNDGSLSYGYEYEHNLVLDKPEWDETEEEWTLMEKLEEERPYSELYEYRLMDKAVWRRD